MNTTEAKQLLEKYNQGLATDTEAELLQYWLIHKATAGMPEVDEAYYAELSASMRPSVMEPTQPRKIKLWPRIAVASRRKLGARRLWGSSAAAVIGIAICIWLYRPTVILNLFQDPNALAMKNDIAPGKQGATLTLANGKKIKLSDAATGQLAKEAGVTVTKTANGQLVYSLSSKANATDLDLPMDRDKLSEAGMTNVLSTAKGETYMVTLPDKSKVWLNAASSLTYSASLNERGLRRVRLEGEAYFEVAKDKTRPFKVVTKGQTVTVLGTHFNINTYNLNGIKTTLAEGSIDVNGTLLKPSQQAVLNDNKITVSPANVERDLAWKNGYFRFQDQKIQDIMDQLSRWYNIEVVYQGDMPDDTFNGTLSRSKNISQVLNVLQGTKLVHFKIEGRRVTVVH